MANAIPTNLSRELPNNYWAWILGCRGRSVRREKRVNNLIEGQIKTFIDLRTNYDDIVKLVSIYPEISHELLRSNIQDLYKTDNSFKFISQLKSGYVELNCPINNTPAKCRHSIPLMSANALFFKGQEPFYVLQGNFCIEALYYPEISVFILFRGCLNYEIKLQRLLKLIDDKGHELKSYFDQSTVFGGFYCFHQSPYHYYYFKVSHLLPALEKVDGLNNISVYSLSGQSFLDLSQATDKVSGDFLLEKMFTLKEQINKSYFYVCIGENRKKLISKNAEACDATVRKYLTNKKFNSEKLDKITKIKNTHYILWLGITTGKRTWIEQVSAYKKLIEKLNESVGDIIVVIDGWTKGRGFKADTPKSDNKLANELMNYFIKNKSVEFIDLVAEEAEVKAKMALDVDFFVANHATGSIWISRVAGAKGVTHISNVARDSAIAQHIHPNAQLIPKNDINDIESENAQTPFHVSYSITPDKFMDTALPLALESYHLKNSRLKSWKIFNRLRFTEQTQPAEALRDIAVLFYEMGDEKTAYNIMCKALEQRPNCPFIKQKVNDWKPKP